MAHIGVRISKQDKEKLDEIAKETDTTISEITRSLLDKFAKAKNGYAVFFSSGNVGAAYYEYDEDEAQKIFSAIGISLEE